MQRATMKSLISFLSFLITLLFSGVLLEDRCPPPEDITPCLCYTSTYNHLDCFKVHDDNILRSVFQHSKKYAYKEVKIWFSTLKYLPKEMFENVFMSELYLQNVTLNKLFESPPNGPQQLSFLRIADVKIKEASHWDLIKPMSHLQTLSIFKNKVEIIGSNFAQYVTKELKQLELGETGLKEIKPGAFEDFTKLERILIQDCKLLQLSRDIFPKPFNVLHLHFINNGLKSIPDDLFTDMPLLQTVALDKNHIQTVPQTAFDGNARRLYMLTFPGNPLNCDCRLKWLIQAKPGELTGSCATPAHLHDRLLTDLKPEELKCHL